MSRSLLHGAVRDMVTVGDGVRRQREFPQRQLNAKLFGHSDARSADGFTYPSLGGCGRVVEGGSWVPVFNTGERWSPGSLASCGNDLLCDWCSRREQAKSVERYRWHFEDWLAGGGQLLHVRLSFAHGRGDDLSPMLNDLKRGFESLRKSKAWAAAGIVDWVRVLHIRWSPDRGWYPHYHVVGFVRPGHDLDEAQVEDGLQCAWRDRVSRSIGRRVSRSHGLFARVLASGWAALYAWSWADEDDEPHGERRDIHRDDSDTDDDDEQDERSWPLYRLAEAALDGDPVAYRAWEELCRALKGVPVVRCSKMLTTVWKAHQAEIPQPEPEVIDRDPVVMVDASLWERARRRGATEMGLEIGRTLGLDAMAQWWATELGVSTEVDDRWGCPRVQLLSARDGPRVPSPSLN